MRGQRITKPECARRRLAAPSDGERVGDAAARVRVATAKAPLRAPLTAFVDPWRPDAGRAPCETGVDVSHDRLRCKQHRGISSNGPATDFPRRSEAVTLATPTPTPVAGCCLRTQGITSLGAVSDILATNGLGEGPSSTIALGASAGLRALEGRLVSSEHDLFDLVSIPSVRLRKPSCRCSSSPISSMRWRRERPRRSRRHTTRVSSPSRSSSSARFSCGRSCSDPDAVPLKQRSHPAALSASSCSVRRCF